MNYVVPTDRKFLCQHRNGDTFATLPTTDFVTYMQGLTIEKMKLVATYEVSTITSATSLGQITATDVGTQIKLTHPFNDWSIEGFVVGNSIRVEANSNNVTETVENIVGQDMYISDTAFIATLGVISGDARADYVIKVLTVPTSLIFKFGIISDTLSGVNYNSLLDGQEQVYSANGISAPTTLDYLATESSNLGSVVTDFISTGADLYTHTFTVDHIFRVPHFIAQWLTNYINGTLPFTFAGSNTYRYVSQLNFGVNINNPNDGKIFNDSFLLGSIGFRGQNFNAGSSVYSLQSGATYTVGGSLVSNPEATDTTFVSAQIKKNNGSFTAGVKGYLYHSRLTDENDYSNNDNTYETNFIFDQLFNTDGALATSSTIITNLLVTINVDPTLLDISFQLIYPAGQQALIDAGDNLLMELVVEDAALSATLSDRTPVEIGLTTWTKNADVPGQITLPQLDIKEVGSTTSRSNANTWGNQSLEINWNFLLTKTADSNDAILTNLKIMSVGLDTATNLFFINQQYDFPLISGIAAIPIIQVGGTGYQAFNINSTRFLSVPAGDSLREVQVTSVVPGAFAATQAITGKVGMIINWQEWIENASVDNDFYNGALPDEFFNLNRRTANYSGVLGNYDIYIFLVATVLSGGVETDYTMFSDKCLIADFDVDAAAGTWTAVTSLYDSNDDLTDDIYNQDIRIEVVFSAPGAGVIPVGDVMGTVVIEETNNTGRHWRLHTALDYSETANPLKPLTGETRVKLSQDIAGNTFTLECYVDGTMLDSEKSYNIYAHLNDDR